MEKRRNIRYHSSESKVIQLFYFDEVGNKHEVSALVADESHKGMAVVIVGFYFFPKKTSLYWQETKKIVTNWNIVNFKELDERVYRLALELSKQSV